MSFLSKIFNYIPKSERQGIKLEGDTAWEIDNRKSDASLFFRKIKHYIPEHCIIYLEGTSIRDEVSSYYASNKASNATKVDMGTIWPKPSSYQIPANSEIFDKLVYFLDNYAEPEVCDHLIIYCNSKVLVSGYDFMYPVVWLSRDFSENVVKEFCSKVKCTYKIVNTH
jgi:hypothetical protein